MLRHYLLNTSQRQSFVFRTGQFVTSLRQNIQCHDQGNCKLKNRFSYGHCIQRKIFPPGSFLFLPTDTRSGAYYDEQTKQALVKKKKINKRSNSHRNILMSNFLHFSPLHCSFTCILTFHADGHFRPSVIMTAYLARRKTPFVCQRPRVTCLSH